MNQNHGFLLQTMEWVGMRKKLILLFSFILGVGFFVRFYQLEWHFTTTDDLLILLGVFDSQKAHDFFHISKALTNAPFEYFFTYFLISPDMSYIELLYWGRLPSCVAGCLALVFLLGFYFFYDREKWHKAFLALVLVACSWENIAYAKQMHSYAIGVLGAAVVFFLLAVQFSKASFSWQGALISGVVITIACSMQYQVFLFVPAFYLSLFLFHLENSKSKALLLRNFFLGGIFCLFLIWPIWHWLLKTQFHTFQTQWALGPSGEYGLPGPNFPSDFFAQIGYVLWFYFHNLFVIFESKIGFFPEADPFFKSFSTLLSVFFLFGIINFITSREKKVRFFGIFFGLVLLTWWVMVPLKQLPYGPSRHTLILLPFFAVTAGEGIEGMAWIFERFTGQTLSLARQKKILLAVGLLVLFFFTAYYGQFLKERRNPVVEEEIVNVLQEYDVNELFYAERSFQLGLMKKLKACREQMREKNKKNFDSFAVITRYPTASPQQMCEIHLVPYTQWLRMSGGVNSRNIPPCSDFHLVFEKKFEFDVMEWFSRKLQVNQFANRFYFYIFSLDPGKKRLASKFDSNI